MTLDSHYQALVDYTLSYGKKVSGRNGNTLQVFAPAPLVVNDCWRAFPQLQSRTPVFYKSLIETLFFLSGKSNFEAMPSVLRDSWWKPWADKAMTTDNWGTGFYSSRWRYSTSNLGEVTDPLLNLLDKMTEVINSGISNRKMVITLWNDADLSDTVLEPCHSTSLVFNLRKTDSCWRLDLHHTQRSLDLMCGTNADLCYSGFLLNYLSKWLYDRTQQLVRPGRLIFQPVQAHIYEAHITTAETWLAYIRDINFQDFQIGLAPTEANTLEHISEYGGPDSVPMAKQLVSHNCPALPGFPTFTFPLVG